MGRYTPQTPCAPRAAKHPLRVCSAPRSLKYPRRKEVPPIDFCHIPVSIIKRSAGRSAVAAAAYRSGTKLTNEWDGLTHDYTRKGGVVHAEIMLPAHAPPEFADRSILWNSVEQIEKARDSQLAREIEAALPRELSGEQQLALVRAYVKDNFVDKGMCADFAIHDKGTGNPHVHIMLTLRPLKENGQWGAKCRKAYDLDENGQRIPDGKGGWKNHREDTTDWNDKGNVEIWRAAWAAYTNRALESAGRPERIDHRSYKRQGIDKIPSVHQGPAASQMEKRGIRTDKGEVNRQIAADNKLLKEIKARITRLYRWSKAEAEKPQTQQSSLTALWEAQQQLNAPRTRTGKIRALQESAALFSFLQANGIQSMQQLHEKIADMNSRYYDLSAAISALFGISEPALYGVTLQNKRAMVGVVTGSFISALVMGIVGVKSFTLMSTCLIGMPQFVDEANPANFIWACVGFAIAIGVSFVVTMVLYRDEELKEVSEAQKAVLHEMGM